jgi:hypothetical protein
MNLVNLLLEACILGVLNVIFGFIVSYISMGEKAKTFEHWKSVLIGFFIAGVLIHLFCEMSGINKTYCIKGNACKVNLA